MAANYYFISSKRFGKPFHTLNCSALTENSIESELFGHVKGSVSGADKNKVGFFEECDNGILFLDEVTNLSMLAQSKILRAIENKEIQIVGGPMKKVNTSLIFATNADKSVLSDPNRFRQDLFYRIEGNIIELPPLRDRGDDILLLMSFFLTSYSHRFNINEKLDLTTLKDLLLSYNWPGNIRELKNFCKFIMISEKNISNATIIKHMEHKLMNKTGNAEDDELPHISIPNLKQSVALFENDYLMHHLEANNWRVAKTAESIGIERTTLYKKIKQYGIILQDEE